MYQATIFAQDVGIESINNAGDYVGEANGRAFIYSATDGMTRDLTDIAEFSEPGHVWTFESTTDINASGQITGAGHRSEGDVMAYRYFRYSPPQLDINGGEISPAVTERLYATSTPAWGWITDLNDSGDVLIHRSTTGRNTGGFADSTDSAYVFSGPPGQGAPTLVLDAAVPRGINNWGQVTGICDTGTCSKAFVHSPDGSLELFGTISGNLSSDYSYSNGLAINDAGDVSAWARMGLSSKKEDLTLHAVFATSTSSAWQDLGTTYTNIYLFKSRINRFGDVIGASQPDSPNGFVYLKRFNKAYPLKAVLINPPANLQDVFPTDINDDGVICGTLVVNDTRFRTSNKYYGVILSPMPQ
jgi:hypothetical protein